MSEPSMVSMIDIPLAKRTGRHRIAYQGRPEAAPAPDKTNGEISVAVSNPSPKKEARTGATAEYSQGNTTRMAARVRQTSSRATHRSKCDRTSIFEWAFPRT